MLLMRKLFFTLCFILLFSLPAKATNWCADTNNKGCWLFTEGSGTTVDDSSSGSNVGTFKGTGEPAWYNTSTPAGIDWAVDFDGTDDYISFASNINAGGDKLTIVAWVNPDIGDTWKHIVSQHDDFTMAQGNTNHTVRCAINGTFGSDYAISEEAWTHVACVYNGSTLTTYVNGAAQSGPTSISGNVGTSGTFLLGKYSGSSGFEFNGKLAEVGIFNRELSEAEIDDIIANGLGSSSGGSVSYGTTTLRNCTIKNATIR